jgi:maltooligosyltrehalose trehalohydrolase
MSGHVFRVWAPLRRRMVLHLVHPREARLEMHRLESGWFELFVEDAGHGTRYWFRPDDEKDLPDPASHFQPEGVHGPSEVVDHAAFGWKTPFWKAHPLREMVIYEVHIGTFTPEGTFEAAIARLPDLAELGVNTLELMPVSQFPGDRNWGYDGVQPYAPQNSYGGPEGLKRLVDACHAHGINVLLDVVYNHFGPEGNYVAEFGPYFTDTYKTPWGSAVNLDGAWCDGVREYLSGNILHWFEHYRLDGVRVDAIHAIYDRNGTHFWHYARARVLERQEALGRRFLMIAESDLNDPKVVRPAEAGGFGFDAQWLDDFHHTLYTLLDPRQRAHYQDFGDLEQLAKAYTDGYVHSGEYVSFRKRRHGASSAGIPGDRFIVFLNNHDQVGNRPGGERMSMLVDFERLKVGAAAILLAPYVPLLFMGEEYGEDNPFYFFSSMGEDALVDSIREGRRREFEDFNWGGGEPRDPFDRATFEASRLDWDKRNHGHHRGLLEWHKALLALRAALPALRFFRKESVRAQVVGRSGLAVYRRSEDERQEVAIVLNLSGDAMSLPLPGEREWILELDSTQGPWCTPDDLKPPAEIRPSREARLAPWSAQVYLRERRFDLSPASKEAAHVA